LSFDFRDRIHPISLKFKTNNVKKIFQGQKQFSLTQEEIFSIEDYLSPLFEFMNSNLEVLMECLGEKLALRVVSGVWNRFVLDAEMLIVPSLDDDSKDQKQWDPKRFQFFQMYIQVCNN
jgi:hypothetical protein